MKSTFTKPNPLLYRDQRRIQGSVTCNSTEKKQYRSLVGAIQWSAAHSMIFASARVSFTQARQENPVVVVLPLEANRLLRFQRLTKDIRLQFPEYGAVGCWASRRGIKVFPTNANALPESLAVPFIVLDWSSRNVERTCWSSAVDKPGWVKVYISLQHKNCCLCFALGFVCFAHLTTSRKRSHTSSTQSKWRSPESSI